MLSFFPMKLIMYVAIKCIATFIVIAVLTLIDLRRDERFDERVRCLGVQAQSVSKTLQLR